MTNEKRLFHSGNVFSLLRAFRARQAASLVPEIISTDTLYNTDIAIQTASLVPEIISTPTVLLLVSSQKNHFCLCV